MKGSSSNTDAEVFTEESYEAFLLSLRKMQKLPEIVEYLYTFQSMLGFSSLYLALPREENKHLRIKKTAANKKLLLHSNGLLEQRVFREERRVILETPDNKTWLAMPLHGRG